ncbi:PHD finger domain-containing protein [Nannizzia gypsea CBS 118893]|uniref:PHD finger domain-containing protein n=1 Tax=Arthroderma gypseum (strain ATCC MYA-4604 / CBS 118893) TaxID=535722 RepID=E4V2I0_ARTGP|nr:PHD finger domain-containing protein [Nannizzia gypsea CBS 118893]EFR04245.1 PHD finger domain-containing protein [Nannizzia gypsea CBS 118893]
MNWDYPIHSFTDPNVEPQTPTRTPTTSSFETPKLESSFYDPRVTWNTADPYASSPELVKFPPPRFDLASPSPQRGQLPEVDGGDGLASNSVRKTRPLSTIFSSGPDMSDGVDATSRSAASMQTPPPTSTSRRRTLDAMNVTTDDAATPVQDPNPNRLETPSRFVGLSPNFYGLQGTPDLFRVAGASATDPSFIPRYQMPWDQENIPPPSTMMDDVPRPAAATASAAYTNSTGHFDISTHVPIQQPIEPFDADPASEIGLETPRLPVTQSIGRRRVGLGVPQDLRYLEAQQGAGINSSFSTSPRVPLPQDDDPSMFLSSPARRFGFSDPSYSYSPHGPRVENRQPYHYQTEESERDRRERGLCKVSRTRSVGHPRRTAANAAGAASAGATTNYEDPYASLPRPPSGRPAPRRITTHSGAVTRQASFSSTTASALPGSGVRKTPSKGRTSPFKQMHSFQRSSSLAAPMEALVLKVGKDGIATTEMKLAAHSQSQLPDVSPDISIEELSTESDSDISETSERRIGRVQNPPYHFPDITPRRSRVARTPSSSRPHSKCSSRSSTVGSSHSGYNPGWTDTSRGRGKPLDAWNGSRRHSRNYSITDSETTQGDDDEEETDDAGHAQHALKQVLQARKRHSAAVTAAAAPASATIGYASASRASHSLAMATLRSSPPLVGYPESYAGEAISPTKMTDPDAAPTPVVERQSNPSTGTRCVCNSRNNGGHLMIQCESCTHWLHTRCVGLDRQSLPPVYICVYCVQTPVRRHRAPDPRARGGHVSSPLTHKSYGFK